MKRERSERFRRAMLLLEDGAAREALALADEMISSEDEGDRLAGYFCRGAIFEDGGDDLTPDIDQAMYSYRQASLIVPDAVTFGSLAKMSMKKGGDVGFRDALKYLQEASKIEETADIKLGFAEYYKARTPPDFVQARRYYWKAAKEGRIAGLAGLADVARLEDRPLRALGCVLMTVILGPIFYLLLGAKSRDVF